jgi:type III secretion system (T3SS) SseB-like protein
MVSIREGENVLISQPRVIPDRLLENLSALFRSVGDVDEAFFAQIHFASRSDSPHLLIQVKFRDGFKGDLASLDSGIREAIRGAADAGPVDFAVVTDKPYDGTRRFYKRAES